MKWSEQSEVKEALLKIPNYMRSAVIKYVEDGQPVGDFLEAIISNKLVESFGAADDSNGFAVRAYANLLYNHFPSGAWGSRDIYEAWIVYQAEQRELAESAV